MREQSTIMGWHITTGKSPVCLDCLGDLAGQPLALRRPIHSYDAPEQCAVCHEPINGPIHLDPGASSWGPTTDDEESAT